MNRPRILRLLRIAFSALCGTVCLMLNVIWVPSYWWAEYLHVNNGKSFYKAFRLLSESLSDSVATPRLH